ncbi:MAG: aldo/keto reductase [Tannerella sp.]|jgi:aryl-alcohol dehydrogenase-like predicted oxidoreductase|nr:aldo/keto reductase [Tannerella sp.]
MEQKRKIGNSELYIRPFVLGGNVFGWTADKKESFRILDAYIDAGFDFIDTANVYSNWVPGNKGGESETIIGEWIKKTGKRDEILIATKVGAAMSDGKKSLKKDYIMKEAEASLKRLNTDYIDLYFVHYDDTSTPVEETLGAFAKLIEQGKVGYTGASNMSPERIKESLESGRKNDLPAYVCLEPAYNLYDRQAYERDYEPLIEQYGLGVISYYSLASGFLTGKYKTKTDLADKQRGGKVEEYLNGRGERIIKALNEVAAMYNATPAQIALAWIKERPSVTAPIASVSKHGQLDILKSVDIHLSKEAMNMLNNASSY